MVKFKGRKTMAKKVFSIFFLFTLLCLTQAFGQEQAPQIIKLATLAPAGTTWMKVAEEFSDYVEKKVNGRIKFKWYTGGVVGDEPDMIRKIQMGQLHGAGLSGMGLGRIVPEVRVLELPLIFNSYDEIDYVLKKLEKPLSDLFEKHGYKLMGWAEQGFIYVFLNKDVRTFEDLHGVKMWVWSGDNFAMEIFKSVEALKPIPIAVPEVLVSLQTKLIDAFYNTPLGAAGLQWYPYVKYYVDIPFTYGTGAVVVDKKSYDALSQDIKDAIAEGASIVLPKLKELTRKDNEQLLKEFQKSGIKPIKLTQEAEGQLREKVKQARVNLIDVQFPEWLLTGVLQSVYEYRQMKK